MISTVASYTDQTKLINGKLPSKVKRPIPTYEGIYVISGDGVIESLDRKVLTKDGHVRRYKGRVMRVTKNIRADSEMIILSQDGVCKPFSVKTLMKMTFPEIFPPVVDLPDEDWKATNVPYLLVSNLGRVKRLGMPREVQGIKFIDCEFLYALPTAPTGHYVIPLSSKVADREVLSTLSAGRVMYEAFIGKIPEGARVVYVDGDPKNLRPDNLDIDFMRFHNREP